MPNTLPPERAFQGAPSAGRRDHFFCNQGSHPALPLTIQRELLGSGETTGEHRHVDFLALYAVRRGSGVHQIDDAPYALVRGDIYLLASGATHSYRDFQDLELDAIYFQPTLFREDELEALRRSPGLWRLFAGGVNLEHRIHLTPEEWQENLSGLEAMRREWTEDSLSGEVLLRQALFRHLIFLARQLERRAAVPGHEAETKVGTLVEHAANAGRRVSAVIAEAVRYCEENAEKELTVPQIAERFFFSPGHFSEVFRREVGMPPAAYIRRVRLEKARTLLRTTELSIPAVATQSGFGDPAHFSRIFRSHYGHSPLKYRKRAQ